MASAAGGWCLSVLLLLTGVTAAAQDLPPLKLGILPYTSTLNLLAAHQPLRRYLQGKLGRPVELYTASSFSGFVRDSQRGDYDLLLTAPHFARLAQKEVGYVPLARYASTIHPRLVVAKDDPMRDVSELNGSRIANADRLALVTAVAVRWLGQNGLRPSQYELHDSTTHANAILAVTKGESRAAITSRSALLQMSSDVQEQVRSIDIPSNLPHLMVLAHPRLAAPVRDRVRNALLNFARESAEGNGFLQSAGYIGFVPVSARELHQLDPYVNDVKRALEARP